MGEIYLIRHGQASFGEQNYDRLSGLGIEQSRRLGAWLRANGIAFDDVYSGERERQQDTARHALLEATGTLPETRIDPAFNELDADRLLQHAIPHVILREPSLAPMVMDLRAHRDHFRRVFERIVDEWVAGEWQGAGIGTWDDFAGRVLGGLLRIGRELRPGTRVAVFTSGGPITATMNSLSPEPLRGLDWSIANTSITRLGVGPDGGLTLLARRVVPHLESDPGLLTHL